MPAPGTRFATTEGLNPRHLEFVLRRVQFPDEPLYRSAEAVGYARRSSSSTATALLQNPKIIAAIAERQHTQAIRADISVSQTLRELARVALSDIRALLDPNGALLPPSAWPDNAAAAVASYEVKTTYDRDGNPEREEKVRLWPKMEALRTVAQHLGMLVERHSVDVTGLSAELDGLTEAELDARIRRLLEARERRQLTAGATDVAFREVGAGEGAGAGQEGEAPADKREK